MKNIQITDKQIVIYQAKTGAIEIKKDIRAGTVWATQADIVKLYEKDQSVISRHINNIFKDSEVNKKSNMQRMHIANSDKPVEFYSLDIILAVGYRTNSRRAIEFRQWATRTLRRYIVDGYAINKHRVFENYQQFVEAVEAIRKILPVGTSVDAHGVIDIVNMFADTWLSLNAYDKDALVITGVTKKRVALTGEKLLADLTKLKTLLMKNGEATELFGQERSAASISGIVGNLMQSFGGKELYPTVEEKAAHLLYFIVKNHPFIDGNKRSGAYAFVSFLRRAGLLDTTRITPPALTALTLLVAESDTRHKEKMIKLILLMLSRGEGKIRTVRSAPK
jgi:prophage maintenance system killer protein